MTGNSAEIEALLFDGNDLNNPTPGMLPAIFRDIVGRLDAAGLAYAVIGRIALALHEQARFVREIEIVVGGDADEHDRIAALARATQARFAAHMDPRLCRLHIVLTVRPSTCAAETQLLADAVTCQWFGVQARLASAEYLLWLWCRSDSLDHAVDASALIKGGAVDLYSVRGLLRTTDDVEESGQRRLRLAIGDAVLSTTSSFSRYMAKKRARLNPDYMPVWRRLQAEAAEDDDR